MRKANISLAIAAVLILTGFTYLAVNSGVATQKLQMKTIKLQSTEQKLNSINVRYEKLDTQLKTESSVNKDKINDLKSQQEKLQQEKQDLEAKLQAKAVEKQKLAEAAERAAQAATQTQVAYAAAGPTPVNAYSGSHQDWMAAAGIDPSNYGYVDYIVSHESGWNPCAYYPSKSNCSLSAYQVNATDGNAEQFGVACGLGMSLACGKWGENWNDPINQLAHMNTYVQKFGGWAGAYNYWTVHRSY